MSGRLMIVDDAPFVREVLAQIARKGGLQIVGEAGDGEEAVILAEQIRPDIILMDIVMPKKSGIEATKEILKILPDVKIIACTTEGNDTMIMKAVEAGCTNFIVKPFQLEQVIRVLKSCLPEVGL